MVISSIAGDARKLVLRFAAAWAWRDRLIIVTTWAFATWPWLRGRVFTSGDNVAFFFPHSSFVVSSLLHGQAPWWNPYLYGGQPVLGDPQSMIFTPHTLVGLVLGQHFNLHTYDLTSLACILCGGLALHQYGRRYADNRLWPLLGALVFMFGGVASSRLQHVGEIISYSLLPVLLLAIRGACETPSAGRVLLLTLASLGFILNPNQVVFLSAFGLLPFFIMHALQSKRPAAAVLACGGAAVLALAAASPMLLAMAEYLAVSNRTVAPLWVSSVFSLSLNHLPGLVLPGLFGVATKNLSLWSPTDADMGYLYIGILPACLLLWSFIRLPKLHLPALIALGMAVLACLFALGTNTPFYSLLYAHIPGFSGFRRPGDAAFLMNFFISVLIAVLRPTDPQPAIPWRWRGPGLGTTQLSYTSVAAILILAAAAAILALHAVTSLNAYAITGSHLKDLFREERDGAHRALILLAAIGLPWCFGRQFAKAIIPPILITLTTCDLCSAGRFSPVHVLSYDDSVMARVYRRSHPDAATLLLSRTVSFLRNNDTVNDPHGARAEIIGGPLSLTMPEFERIEVTQGYNPLLLAAYADTIGAQTLAVEPKLFRAASNGYDSDAYRSLGLHYVLFDQSTLHDAHPPGSVGARALELRNLLAFSGPSLSRPLGTIGAYEVWEMRNAYPKADILPRGSANGACRITRYRNTSLNIECQAKQAATLVVAENAAPGWLACVNGAPAPISTYAGLLRSVEIPAGVDTITMRYEPVRIFRGSGC
jgi:hypothetical protein